MTVEVFARIKSRRPEKQRRSSPPARVRAVSPLPGKRNNTSCPKPGLVRRFFKVLLSILQIFIVYQVVLRLLRRYFKFPAPAFIGKLLDSDIRRRTQPADLLVERSGARAGMRILEIGCGSGAYTTSFARTAGESGRVYALDIQPGMLKQIQYKLQQPENQDIQTLQIVAGSAYELPFEKASLDLIYMVTVFQEIPDRARALKEVRRVLKRHGILAISELLPDPDYPWVTTTVRMGKEGGLHLEDVEGNLWNYTVRFKKP
ncbi:MAG: methyltransferase domain-containing protein [Anaerolineaceae bacterium]|nr:methyltransferase domain-containing protein [Anaerolineaceae bacterium]